MKKNTNKPTFAQRAKKIMSKYPRAEFDKVEKEAMEMELDSLMAEQEAMKQALGMGAPSDQQTELDINQAVLDGQMQEPQMFDGGGFWPTIRKGLGYVGDAYSFLDSGAGVLPQESYDPAVGSIPYNMGIAPVPGRGMVNPAAKIQYGAQTAKGMATNLPRSVAPNAVRANPVVTPKTAQGAATYNASSHFNAAPRGTALSQSSSPSGITAYKPEPAPLAGMQSGSVKPAIGTKTKPLTAKELQQIGQPPVQTNTSNLQVQRELDKAFGKVGKGTTKLGPAGTKTTGGTATTKQLINGTIYDVEPGQLSSNIPWNSIGYGATGVGGLGLIGAGIYNAEGGVSNNMPIGAQMPNQASSQSTSPTARGYVPSFYGPESEMPVGAPTTSVATPSRVAGGTSVKATPKTASVEEQNAAIIQKRIQDGQGASGGMSAVPYLNKQGAYTTDFANASMGGLDMSVDPVTGTLNLNNNSPKLAFEGDKLKARSQAAVDTLDTGKKTNEFLPSYIAAGASMLGNIGQMFMDKKPKDLSFARYSPEEINLSEQRLAAEREADLGRAVGRNAARNLGMGAGAAMSNIVSSESGVSRNLSDALMKSKLAEETTNMEARNKAGQFNAELGMREGMINKQSKDAWGERQREYFAGAVGAIPDAMRDVNQIKAQKEYLVQMGMSEENAMKWLAQKYPQYMLDMEGKLAKGTIFKGNK